MLKLTSNFVMSPLNKLTFSASPAFQTPALAGASYIVLARDPLYSSFHDGMLARETWYFCIFEPDKNYSCFTKVIFLFLL